MATVAGWERRWGLKKFDFWKKKKKNDLRKNRWAIVLQLLPTLIDFSLEIYNCWVKSIRYSQPAIRDCLKKVSRVQNWPSERQNTV